MIKAVFKVMLLRLLRDRGALFLAFLLPPFIFTVFAAIFSNAAKGDMDLDVAMAVTSDSELTLAVAEKFAQNASLNVSTDSAWSAANIYAQINGGDADVGVVFDSDLTDLAEASVTIIVEPSRTIAAPIIEGQLQRTIAESAPTAILRRDAATISRLIGGYTDEQKVRLEATLQIIQVDAEVGTGLLTREQEAYELFRRTSSLSENFKSVANPTIAYYAGATAIMFLLFSLTQGASIVLEERRSGISGRLLLSQSDHTQMMLGRFVYLTAQGLVQITFILFAATLLFSVPVLAYLWPLTLMCICISACAAGLALMVVTSCNSSAQANTISTFLVLIMSSIGGSMVPRFMMPEWLQSLGYLTPNAWAIDGVYNILVRGDTFGTTWQGCLVLMMMGVVGVIFASLIAFKKANS